MGNATTAITIDYSKAFDYVDHNILIQKLLKLGVRGSIINLIISFLTNRTHCTNIAGNRSDYTFITCGVPQGTVIGPRLFVILINGTKCTFVSNYKFVDDKTIALSYKGNASTLLQEALNIEERETNNDKMIINGSKCHSITFNFSTNNVPPDNLMIQGNVIQPCDVIKLLGVYITKDLKWSTNTSEICTKVNKKFFILSKLKQFGFQREELVHAWITNIRPLTEYAAPLWHSGLTKSDTKALEDLQKKALGIIIGTQYIDNRRYYKINKSAVPYEEALSKLGLTPLHKRREILTSKFALQSLNNKLHKNMFQEKEEISIALRKQDKVAGITCKTDRHKNSAIPYMAKIVNEQM